MGSNLVIQKSDECLKNIIEFLKGTSQKVCFITMSRSYAFLKKEMEKSGVTSNVFFIDCISKSLFMGVDAEPDCTFVTIHMDTRDFSDTLSSSIKPHGDCKVLIFDSLSDLKKYWPLAPDLVLNFVKTLFPAIMEMGADSYFVLYDADKDKLTDQVRAAFDGVYSSFSKDKEE